MEYKIQVGVEHYKDSYDSQQRFLSYFSQKRFIFKLAREFINPKILEIGKGNGFLEVYLKKNGLDVKTIDIDPALKPDFVGDISRIHEIVKEHFDIISCFEVLEHIKYMDLSKILKSISVLKSKYLIVSVPQSRLFFSFWLNMNVIGVIQKYINIPFPIKHIFNGEHHWELGKKGYPVRKFRELLSENFLLKEEFINPLDPYHRFFILENKDK